jgi:hypothetical protein
MYDLYEDEPETITITTTITTKTTKTNSTYKKN